MAKAKERKRFGNQNPTQSVKLKSKSTLGDKAIAIYEKGKYKAMPWQKNLINIMLGVNEDGLWTHTKFAYAVPRRNGKNEIVIMREMYALLNGEKVFHTAHRVQTSHSAWEKLVRRLQEAGYVEDKDFTTLKAKGAEKIEFIETDGRVEFRTRTTTGGLGEEADLLVIDEAQEYTEDQVTALQYILAASKNPQTIYCGTPPTMVSSGTVFKDLRDQALEGGSLNTAWCEWSVEEESDVYDVDLWYKTNPALGYTISERSIGDEITKDHLDFNIQRLGYWVQYNQQSAITETEWEELKVKSLPTLVSGLSVGIKYGKDGKNVAMSIAVRTLSKKIFVEALDIRSVKEGNQWIINWLLSLDIENVIIDGAGAQSILRDEMKDYKLPKPVLPTVKEIIIANSKFEQAVFGKKILHNDQASLSAVITNSEKRPIGTQGGFGYKSQYEDRDIALMDSVILAYYICSEDRKIKTKQQIYY